MIKGILLGFLAYSAFALSDAFVKLLEGSRDAYEVAFFGALLGTLALPFIKRPEDRWRDVVVTGHRGMWLLRAVAATATTISSVIAFTLLPMAEAFALIFLQPAFVTILSVVLLKEDVRWRRWSAVAVGFVGVMVVLHPGFRELSVGHLAALICGLSSAISVIIFRVLGESEKRITLYGAGLIGPIAVCGVLMLADFSLPTKGQWLFILGYGLLAAAGNILLMFASHHAPASQVAPTKYVQMLWGIGPGYVLFRHPVDVLTVIGAVIIIASGLFTLIRKEQRTKWWRLIPLSSRVEEPGCPTLRLAHE